MPFCEKCGAEMNKGAKFCESCGAKNEGAAERPAVVRQAPLPSAPQASASTIPQPAAQPAQPAQQIPYSPPAQPQYAPPVQPPERGANNSAMTIAIVVAAIGVVSICLAAAIHFGLFGGKKPAADTTPPAMAAPAYSKPAGDGIAAPASAPQNTTCPSGFVFIQPGAFTLGAPQGEYGRSREDVSPQQVTLTRGFCLAQYETTLGEWQNVMSYTPQNNSGDPSVRSFAGCGSQCPVIWVSWTDAQNYIRKYNSSHGGGYRLPTEMEWEYAARAGSGGSYPNGNYVVSGCDYNAQLNEIAWYCGNSDQVNYPGWTSRNDSEAVPGARYFFINGGPHPVGQKQPNTFGLYDIIGNAREWMQDNYCTRGGSWFSPGARNRVADRLTYGPNDKTYNIGFRLAYDNN